jgi:hypothetical protein
VSARGGSALQQNVAQIVLAPAIGWAMILLVVVSALFRGATPPLINLLVILVPGFAYVPGIYFAIRLRRASSRDESSETLRKVLLLAGAGLALFVGAAVVIFATGES